MGESDKNEKIQIMKKNENLESKVIEFKENSDEENSEVEVSENQNKKVKELNSKEIEANKVYINIKKSDKNIKQPNTKTRLQLPLTDN